MLEHPLYTTHISCAQTRRTIHSLRYRVFAPRILQCLWYIFVLEVCLKTTDVIQGSTSSFQCGHALLVSVFRRLGRGSGTATTHTFNIKQYVESHTN